MRLNITLREVWLLMLTEKYSNVSDDKFVYEFKNVEKELLPWFESIVYENNSIVEKKEWCSRYNSYVIYDYEPFCSEGFDITVVVSSRSRAYLEFIKYLYDNKISLISYLNKCIAQ